MKANTVLSPSIITLSCALSLGGCSGSDFAGPSGVPKAPPPRAAAEVGAEASDDGADALPAASPSPKAPESATPGEPPGELGAVELDPSFGSAVDTSGCLNIPGGKPKITSDKPGANYRATYFHESFAVDPGKTGQDRSGSYGWKPYTVSPDDTLAKTDFVLTKETLTGIIEGGTTEIEYAAFAHQFDKGLDKIWLTLKTKDVTLSDVSSTNIYSAYGYISIKNMQLKGGIPYGDVDLFSFNYDPNGTSAVDLKLRANPSVQDATNMVGPASEGTAPKVSRTGLKLDGFKVTIEIGADLYDSVQYRALRANFWAPNQAPKLPELCD